MDLVRHQLGQPLEDIRCDPACRPIVQFDKDTFRYSVNGDEHIQLALGDPNFGDIDVKVTDGT